MPLVTETINCDLTLPSGGEYELGRMAYVFRLDKEDADRDGAHLIPPAEIRVAADADGEATVTLWPNDRGVVGSGYRVTVEVLGVVDGRGAKTVYDYGMIYVSEDGGPYNLSSMVFLEVPTPPSFFVSYLTEEQYDAAIAAVDAAEAWAENPEDVPVETGPNKFSALHWAAKAAASAASITPEDFATAAQGDLADTAVQPADLADVATSGEYDDLVNNPWVSPFAVAAPDRDFDTVLAGGVYAVTDDWENGPDGAGSLPYDGTLIVVPSGETTGASYEQTLNLAGEKWTRTGTGATPTWGAWQDLRAAGGGGVGDLLAWVNFNGTGTVAIRGSGNVESITDHGEGDYSIVYTNETPDANYVVTGTAQLAGAVVTLTPLLATASGTDSPPTTTSVRVQTRLVGTPAVTDATYVMVAIFGA